MMQRVLLAFFLILLWVIPSSPSPRYVFLFIGDGLGQEQIDLCTEMTQHSFFSEFPVHVFLGTQTRDGTIPDSASSATSIACGIKVTEGVLAQDASGRPLETIAEKAKKKGFRVGIVTNVALNDATPAAFYAHTSSRKNYDDIAWQMVESGFDLFVGSGIVTTTRLRRDEILRYAAKQGYRIVTNFQEFLALEKGRPVLALLPFTFAIDRTQAHPNLAQCVRKAIELLENPSGFFLIVEGGRIDWCNHMNDIVSSLKELEDFNAAICEALLFGQKYPQETLILVTADHETGGLRWERKKPFTMPSQKGSYDRFLTELRTLPQEEVTLRRFLVSFWGKEKGEAIEKALKDFLRTGEAKTLWISLARSFAEEAGISWSTLGHTAAFVPLYVWGEGASLFAGARENTDIAEILTEILLEKVVFEHVF